MSAGVPPATFEMREAARPPDRSQAATTALRSSAATSAEEEKQLAGLQICAVRTKFDERCSSARKHGGRGACGKRRLRRRAARHEEEFSPKQNLKPSS